MAQRIKLATNLIAMEELIHATHNAIREMVPGKYIYHQCETPAGYQCIMDALEKLYEASQKIRNAKKIIKPEITNLNISKKLWNGKLCKGRRLCGSNAGRNYCKAQ